MVLKEWDVELDPEAARPRPGSTITFEYDVDGILRVKVVDRAGVVMMDEEMSFGAGGSKSDLVGMRRNIDSLETTDACCSADALGAGGAHRGLAVARDARRDPRRPSSTSIPIVDDATQAHLDDMRRQARCTAPAAEDDLRRELELVVREHSYLL